MFSYTQFLTCHGESVFLAPGSFVKHKFLPHSIISHVDTMVLLVLMPANVVLSSCLICHKKSALVSGDVSNHMECDITDHRHMQFVVALTTGPRHVSIKNFFVFVFQVRQVIELI